MAAPILHAMDLRPLSSGELTIAFSILDHFPYSERPAGQLWERIAERAAS